MSYDYDYDYEYEDEGFGLAWPLIICLGLGIWLVVDRYKSVRNRAVPFRVAPPDVSIENHSIFLGSIPDHVCSISAQHGMRPKLTVQHSNRMSLTRLFVHHNT